MESENIEEVLKKLTNQVNDITNNIKNNDTNKYKSSNNDTITIKLPNLSSPYIYYGIIPLSIFIILLIYKPNFLYKYEPIYENIIPTATIKKLCFSKLLLWTFFITFIIYFIYFIVKYKVQYK
jgi:hypothetical protein